MKQFADFYTKRDFSKCQAYIKKLWGDNFMDAQGKWSKKAKEGSVRGFNKLVLDPIYKVGPSLHTLIHCSIAGANNPSNISPITITYI